MPLNPLLGLTDAGVGDTTSTQTVYAINPWELGYGSGHSLPVRSDQSFCLARPNGTSTDGKPVYLIMHLPPGLQVVRLEQIGGQDSDGTQPATWTYNVSDLLNRPLGTNCAPLAPRQFAIETNPAQYGLAVPGSGVASGSGSSSASGSGGSSGSSASGGCLLVMAFETFVQDLECAGLSPAGSGSGGGSGS